MIFDKLMNPAVLLMNRLPFKLKIIAAISMLFVLLILPSRGIFTNYIEKNEVYNNQFIGLAYVARIQNLIKVVQLHRGLSSGYLNGNKAFKEAILKSEKLIDKKIIQLVEFDSQYLDLLKHNKDFVDALSNLTVVKLDSILKDSESSTIFKLHNQIITQLIKTLQEISRMTSFALSHDLRINFIAGMLQEKLLLLQENSGKMRGLAVGVFAQEEASKEQKDELLKLYTLIKSLETNLLDNQILTSMDNYLAIQKQTIFATHKTDEILHTINRDILLSEMPFYDGKLFFKQATLAISEQDKLYKMLLKSYSSLVVDLQNKMFIELALALLGFFAIIFASLYLSTAFYSSIAASLKKLQTASQLIASGKTKIHLKADTKDELGNALLAFNNMSQKLDENISFLDGYKMAIDETSIVSKTNSRGIITFVNKKFCEISGYSEKELIGMPHNMVRHQEVPKSAFAQMWATIKDKKVWKGVIKNRKKDGGYYIVDATIIPVLDSDGELIEYIAVRHDVTELEDSKEEIKKQKIDLLTGLPNRSQLLDDLQEAKSPVLLYLNIDDFANLNDFYGAKIADQTLIFVATLLGEMSKKIGFKLFKLHADEFLLLFEDEKSDEQSYQQSMKEIIEQLESKTIECDSQSCVSITLSGGVAFCELDQNYANLLSYATIARKKAKAENKKFLTYSSEMNQDSDYRNNIEWINKIKEAIEQDRIMPYFQPIINNESGAITKYESLVRLIETDGKVVSPFFFLDIAKKAKLYTKITKIVLDKTFATFEKLPQYDFSVNITVEDITDEDISSYIFEKLERFPHSHRVIFEITESEEIKDYSLVNEFILKVKSFGAKIAIDDFGSGYANFEHIISLNADFIKIDGSLIKNIDKSEDARIITEAIIAFSKKLGSKTVVEFVHNEEVYEKVKEMGADFSQGFYLGEPKDKLVSLKELVEV